MTTKTDFHAIQELQQAYTPAQKGILSQAEITLIRTILEIKDRTDIELQNIRDMAIMLYSQRAHDAADKNETSKSITLMDAMSGICTVIDDEKFARGMPV